MNDKNISDSLYRFQAALNQIGSSMTDFIEENYTNHWTSDSIFHAMKIRTTFVTAMHNFLEEEGLLNLERVSLSPVTDPLAHDIEHSPTIHYKGHPYKTTHSMIYSKFLACFNPKIKGIFVDSPNIRLELESMHRLQRGKYLIDFSQMDIEFKRKHNIKLNNYYNNIEETLEKLEEDYELSIDFFERLIVYVITKVIEKNSQDIKALKIKLEVPKRPFPRITNDEAIRKTGKKVFEQLIAKEINSQFFWITGLMRENYDLIYPYLNKDGSKKSLKSFKSKNIFNYDLCAQSLQENGEYGKCFEVMSGALREWLYEPIVERLIDNKILRVRPKFSDLGELENIEELDGYGPFLIAAKMKSKENTRLFPATAGGGIGIERMLFSLLNGPIIEKVDDLTFFGKNPDSYPIYLY